MYEVVFTNTALKEFKKLTKRDKALFDKTKTILQLASQNPRIIGKALAGYENLWRYRAGDFRLIVLIKGEQLIIKAVRFSHRKDVYKNLDSLPKD